MVMIAETGESKVSLKELQAIFAAKGKELGLEIKVQHEDIFQSMHRI